MRLHENRVFFLNSPAGTGAVGHFNADGTFVNERDLVGFTPGWTHVEFLTGNRVFFLNSPAGTGVVGTHPNGSYVDERDTPVSPGMDPRSVSGHQSGLLFNARGSEAY